MMNSVCSPPFDAAAVAGRIAGSVGIEYVDALPGLLVHPRPHRVPGGAPIVVTGTAPVSAGAVVAPAICVVLDGARPYAADVALEPAVQRDDGKPGRAVRFRAVVPTIDLLPGGHEIRAYLFMEGAWFEAGYRGIWIAPNPLPELPRAPARVRCGVEQVIAMAPDGALLGFDVPVARGDFALLTGWALDPAARLAPAGVIAFDGTGRRWSAPCDVMRPDLRGPLDAAGDRLGFELCVPAEALGRGRHRLQITGFAADGTLFSGEVGVTIDVAGPRRGFPAFASEHHASLPAAAAVAAVENDAPGSFQALGECTATVVEHGTILQVDGWALDGAGGGAATVCLELTADAAVPPMRFGALAGFRRDRPLEALPAPDAPDGWFTARLPAVDVPPGQYRFSLVVLAPDRRRFTRRALGTVTVKRPVTHGAGQAGGASVRT